MIDNPIKWYLPVLNFKSLKYIRGYFCMQILERLNASDRI